MRDEQKPKSPKYKWTKELVNIALNDGMTQEEIARVCRTQQSVVSSWKNGKNKATEQQLAELIRRYGARLNRTTARVYLVYQPPTGTWQETDIGRHLLELRKRSKGKKDASEEPFMVFSSGSTEAAAMSDTRPVSVGSEGRDHQALDPLEQLRRAIYPYTKGKWSLAQLQEEYEASFEHEGHSKLIQVEGPVIFRYTFFIPVRRERPKGWEVGREPVGRWIVHDLQRGKLLLVAQNRRRLFGFGKERCAEQLRALKRSDYSTHPDPEWLESPDDSGRWISHLKGPLTVEELLTFVDAHLRNPDKRHSPHDEQVLPYLIRKTLVEHGHPVSGLDRIRAIE